MSNRNRQPQAAASAQPEVAPEEIAPSITAEAPEAVPAEDTVLPSGNTIESNGFQIVDNTDAEASAPVEVESEEREIGNGFTVVEYK